MKKFIQRSQQEDQEKRDEKYGFLEHRIHEDLDAFGKPLQHEEATYQMVMLGGRRFSRQIEKDGKPLSGGDQKKEAEREKKFLADQNSQASRQSKNSGGDLKLDDQFMSHFKLDVIGREELSGRASYLVTILPEASKFAVRSNSEKVFTHLQGKVWVDAEDYSFTKGDLHLTEPTSFYGILGSIRQLDLFWDRRWVTEKTWLTIQFNLSIDARRLFTNIHMRQESTFTDFKKIAE